MSELLPFFYFYSCISGETGQEFNYVAIKSKNELAHTSFKEDCDTICTLFNIVFPKMQMIKEISADDWAICESSLALSTAQTDNWECIHFDKELVKNKDEV